MIFNSVKLCYPVSGFPAKRVKLNAKISHFSYFVCLRKMRKLREKKCGREILDYDLVKLLMLSSQRTEFFAQFNVAAITLMLQLLH